MEVSSRQWIPKTDLIRNVWEKGTDCIIYVRITDTDTNSYCNKDPQKVLEAVERLEKKKYIQPCFDQRHHFTPFVVSVEGLLGKEARTVIKTLAENEAKKGKVILPSLWTFPCPTQYRDSRSITDVSMRMCRHLE
jgi:hypothetical protein